MRRSDREITDKKRIEEFIASEQIMRIAFYDNGDIYIVPLNYGYVFNDRYIFYFHGAKAGRKYELSRSAPKVGFEIDGKYSLLEGEVACDFSATFQSVVGTGRLSLVEDNEEKIAGLDAIMRQTTSRGGWNYSRETLDAVAVFRLETDALSCKAK